MLPIGSVGICTVWAPRGSSPLRGTVDYRSGQDAGATRDRPARGTRPGKGYLKRIRAAPVVGPACGARQPGRSMRLARSAAIGTAWRDVWQRWKGLATLA